MNFNFIASNNFDLNDFNNVEKFLVSYSDFQTVVLNNEKELKLLLTLLGIEHTNELELKGTEFTKFWNLSEFHLPEFNPEEFNLFYEKWINISGRDNNMDEFGNLVFLQEKSSKWNKLQYRLIVKEE